MACPFSQVIFVFIDAKHRRQTHPICLSWPYISDLHFLVVLDWRGMLGETGETWDTFSTHSKN